MRSYARCHSPGYCGRRASLPNSADGDSASCSLSVHGAIRVRANGGCGLHVEITSKPTVAATRGFYRHLGYGGAAVLPDFHRTGEDTIVLLKTLDGRA